MSGLKLLLRNVFGICFSKAGSIHVAWNSSRLFEGKKLLNNADASGLTLVVEEDFRTVARPVFKHLA